MTARNPGFDGEWDTNDDFLVPMNQRPATVTIDSTPNDNCTDFRDEVRGFSGKHTGGVLFVFADGSTRLINESIDSVAYRALSTINGNEIAPE